MLCFSCDDFKITLGIWLYISAVLLTSAHAHLFVNHLAESIHYEPRREKTGFLAHLSRRLKGELIVYRSIRRPSVRPSVRP